MLHSSKLFLEHLDVIDDTEPSGSERIIISLLLYHLHNSFELRQGFSVFPVVLVDVVLHVEEYIHVLFGLNPVPFAEYFVLLLLVPEALELYQVIQLDEVFEYILDSLVCAVKNILEDLIELNYQIEFESLR